jgi:hypothetical protein
VAAKLAKWSLGAPTATVDAAGTLTAAVPLRDNGVLAVTIRLVMTAAHGLQVVAESAPGDAGLSDFTAWTNK